jgi:FAD/FMN-containing dehydrogenase
MSNIIELLRQAIGADAVRTGDDINPKHFTDWSGHAPAIPLALALPKSTEQVAAVLRICNEHRQSVVPQGGMTGLAGGAVPGKTDICLSLERMNGVEEIDAAAATMTVLAGTPLQTVQEAAENAGFEFALDLGARGSCQIGGTIATNAGGNRVVQFGMMRNLVLGLESVLADGTILRSLNKMQKNNTGYDLKQLFIGSEGTLGVITRAVVRLHPKRNAANTALCCLTSYDSAVALLQKMRQALGGDLSVFELMWKDFFDFGVSITSGKKSPIPASYPLYLLIESAGFDSANDSERFTAALMSALESGILADAIIAQSHTEARALWAIRECTAEFPQFLDPINYDVSLPIGDIGKFVDECRKRFQQTWAGHQALFFGHIGDSNLHVTMDGKSIPGIAHEEVDEIVYGLVQEYAGSVSAEHGIGIHKRKYLAHSRTAEEIACMIKIKQALDPNLILNPGKLFP